MKKRSTRSLIFKILTLLYVLGVMYLCFANFQNTEDIPKSIFGLPIDKVVHFCMFFPFPILAFYAYDRLTDTVLKAFAAIIVIFAFGGIFAGLTEMVQGMLPHRTEDIKDFKADLIALGISSLIVFIIDVSKIVIKRK